MTKNIREVVATLYQQPINDMTFVRYFSFLNESGKITARSLMDGLIIAYTFIEELEAKNESYEGNFREIESILHKLVEDKMEDIVQPIKKAYLETPIPVVPNDFISPIPTSIEGSPREIFDPKEALRLKRIANMAKAREARKVKTTTPTP